MPIIYDSAKLFIKLTSFGYCSDHNVCISCSELMNKKVYGIGFVIKV